MALILHKYEKIALEMEQEIRAGYYPTGRKLPSDIELSEKYDTSRGTIRTVKELLFAKGLVERISNKGYFISKPVFVREQEIISTADMFEKAGVDVTTEIESFEKIQVDSIVGIKMNLLHKEEVYKLKRLRIAQNQLVLIEITYLPASRFPNIKRYDFSVFSLSDVIVNNYDVEIKRVIDEVYVGKITGDYAQRMLGRRKGPVLVVESTMYDYEDIPVKYTKTIGDYSAFTYKATKEKKSGFS